MAVRIEVHGKEREKIKYSVEFRCSSCGCEFCVDREHFYDVNALEKIYECPSYWLKGLELHEQEKIANNEYKQRLVARKEE